MVNQRRARALGGLAVACALTACAGSGEQETIVVTSTSIVPEHTPPPVSDQHPTEGAPAAANDVQSLLDATVANVSATYGGQLGVATVAESGPASAGFTAVSPAWSTIKVPIAVAALRAVPGFEPDARAAITASDNAAAERLYSAVGPEAVDTVLGETGLAATVNTAKLRPEFSTFGQTSLSVADEATFADALACVNGSAPVLELMGQIDPSQAYGLGAVGGVFKGGWGPDTAGAYQVRQFGLVPRGDGTWAPLALTALPGDGTYATGQAMLTAAAQQLAADPTDLPQASCQL